MTRLRSERDTLNQQLADINQREKKAEEDQRGICDKYAGQGRPCSTRTTEIYAKYDKEREPVNAAIKSIDLKLNTPNTSNLDSASGEVKARLNDLIYENQIYRFAAMIYGYDDPTKMTAKQLNTFCFVWFGLIAFAVATLGPLLAICYYRIKYEAEVNRSPWNYLWRAARRFLLRLARRNKIVKIQQVERIVERAVEVPVEVIKEVMREVPVEKVVTAVHELVREVHVDKIVRVETPVEVKIKELIYVPIFTNDPDVLKGQPA